MDAEQTGDEPPSSKGVFEGETALDWRGNGEYDPGTSVPATPFDESPDESERPKSKGPATRYDEIALDQLSKAGFTGNDLADAGIRITHHLGAEQGLTAKELLD